jgi:gluconokinase
MNVATMQSHDAQRPAGPLVLTIDIGSSSVRALIFDREGAPLVHTIAREPHAFRTAADGAVEDDAIALLDKVDRCVDVALRQAGPAASEIAAVAVDTYVSNVLGIDAGGRPLTPVYPYADTRNARQSQALREQLDEAAALERTGCLLRTAYLPARLLWLREADPRLSARVWRWVSVGELLLLRLFGECHVSYSVASWSGLLDRRALIWDAPLLEAVGIGERQLSPLADTSASMQGLRPPYAERWPALAQVPWLPAVGDGAAANVGSGCTGPDRIALTVGTTAAVRVVAPDVERVPMGLWCYRVDGRRALLGGATSEGGNVYAWLQSALRLGDEAEVERALAQGAPDGHGLTVLPFVAGERSPGYAGDVRATISGIGISTSADDIARACLEAVSYRLAIITDLLDAVLPGAQTVVVSGGAILSSPAWMQMLADVLNRPLLASNEREATSRGVALLALEALGAQPDLAALPLGAGRAYQPDPTRHERYAEGMRRQQKLYDALVKG